MCTPKALESIENACGGKHDRIPDFWLPSSIQPMEATPQSMKNTRSVEGQVRREIEWFHQWVGGGSGHSTTRFIDENTFFVLYVYGHVSVPITMLFGSPVWEDNGSNFTFWSQCEFLSGCLPLVRPL